MRLAALLLCVTGVAVAQVPNPPSNLTVEGGSVVPTPTGFRFADAYEYPVSRTDANAQSLFVARGYTGLKTTPSSGDIRAGGYVFTQADTSRASRVLVLESRPSDAPMPGWNYGQTDYYLQLGSSTRQALPADAWIQFWTYATPESRFAARDKTLYPCNGDYPCQSGYYGWIFMWGRQGCEYAGSEADFVPADQRLMCIEAPTADRQNSPEYPWYRGKLDNNLRRYPLLSGRWYQVRLHIDTSQAQGTYEAWGRERESEAWTKIAEYRGGVTANFSWPTATRDRTGHRFMRFPTTVNGQYGNSTTYMDDFVIADSAGNL